MAHYKGTSADGARTLALTRQREADARAFAEKHAAIKNDSAVKLRDMHEAFAAIDSLTDLQFKSETVGLVTAQEFQSKRAAIDAAGAAGGGTRSNSESEQRAKQQQRKEKLKSLSFAADDDDDDSESERSSKRPRLTKNPDVDTRFLPDRARELSEAQLREQLAQKWHEQQSLIKSQPMKLTYSYWSGSGHRRHTTINKGDSIESMLVQVKKELVSDFPEIRHAAVSQLMFVKEDLILPHHLTFYELIVTEARGKSGPLFDFNVSDDVRLESDASKEKVDTHAAKVCLQSWYQRHAHIFPASRWERWEEFVAKSKQKYTTKGGEVR